jgi:hypothetical protein
MSLWLSIRAGRVAGKAGKIYRDVMGKPPSAYIAESMQEVAYYGSDEFKLAYLFLVQELQSEIVSPLGGFEYIHKNLDNPLTQRIVQSLTRMGNSHDIDDAALKQFSIALYRIKGK